METRVPEVVHPRSPLGATALSFLIPGAGSMYGGKPKFGVLILVLYLAAWILFLSASAPGEALLVLGGWVWGMVHAFKTVQWWNRKHGVIS